MQLGCQRLSPEQRQLGEAIIDHLNEHGYLEDPLEELAGPLGADMGRLKEALRDIQQLDPPGIGARNLQATLASLEELRIRIVGQDTGGSYGRTVIADAGTGRMEIRAVRIEERIL